MAKLNFIVVSTPRSATRYMARILTKCGIRCGHENWFHFTHYWDKADFHLEDGQPTNGLQGDASWLAAAFLNSVPPDVPLFYQMRPPWLTLNSVVQQNLRREPFLAPNQWAPQVIPGKWPEAIPDRAVALWLGWHHMIQDALPRFKRVLRYRTTDIDLQLIERICGLLDHPFNWAVAAQALEHPKNENTRGGTPGVFTEENLSDAIANMWDRHRLTPEKEVQYA